MAYETTLRKPQLGKLISGNTKPPIWHVRKISSATFGANSFVTRSGGRLKKIADGSAAAASLLGLALEAGAVGSSAIAVLIATNDVLFSIPIDGDSTASKVLSAADLGTNYELKTSSGACTVVDMSAAEIGRASCRERV